MAMLAEPRRKQRWTLNPRGKLWSDDSNKFGQKMLEKMGWSSGKGLGRNMDGMTEHIRARYKDDQGGIGYTDKDRDKQWTRHQAGFNELLQQLQNGETAETTSKEAELSGKSLELKSKQSKARVHYHKFTRGKDVNKYSAKDLANIFGKKDLSEKPVFPSVVSTEVENELEEESAEPLGTSDTCHGVMTIKGGSIADYFKSKMLALGRKSVTEEFATREIKKEPESEDERYAGFGFTSSGYRNDGSNLDNGAFENPALDNDSPDVTVTPGKRRGDYVFENAALDLGNSPQENTSKIRLSEHSFVNAGLDLESTETDRATVSSKAAMDCTSEIAPPEESSTCVHEVTRKKRRKKSKDCSVLNPGYVEEAVNPDERDQNEFEVPRSILGLANVGLDLSDESSGKKRVTFNERVEYEAETRSKKRKHKNAAKLDKFEVDNEKLRKKRKRDRATMETCVLEAAFSNEAMDPEIRSEEANDNALNERKIQRARRKRDRRMSSLETIVEAPEEDREVSRVLEVVSLDDSLVCDASNEPEIVDLVTPKRKKKKKRRNNEENVCEDESTSSPRDTNTDDAAASVPRVIEVDGTNDEDIARLETSKQPESLNDREIDTDLACKKSRKHGKVRSEEAEIVEELDETEELTKEKSKKKKTKKSVNKENVAANEENELVVESAKKQKKPKKEKVRISQDEWTVNRVSLAEKLSDESPRIPDKSFESAATSEMQNGAQSPWDGKGKISKKIIKALFTRSPVINFAGSNINEIRGYGTEV